MAKIPSATESPWANGSWNRSWYEYMRQLGLGATEAELDAVIARVVALEAAETQVQGRMSIQGTQFLSLVGDTDTPGNTYFYGTSATGEKGWQALADALTQGEGITLTVDPDTGLIDVAHADTSSLASFATVNTDGVVVQNVALSFDTFGHVTSALIETIDLDARYEPLGGGGGGSAPTATAIASEALAAGDLVRLWDDTGTLSARKATSVTDGERAHGWVAAAVASSASATVNLSGSINTAVTGRTPGATQFLGAAGGVTETAPATGVVQEVGVALSATSFQFLPQLPILQA